MYKSIPPQSIYTISLDPFLKWVRTFWWLQTIILRISCVQGMGDPFELPSCSLTLLDFLLVISVGGFRTLFYSALLSWFLLLDPRPFPSRNNLCNLVACLFLVRFVLWCWTLDDYCFWSTLSCYAIVSCCFPHSIAQYQAYIFPHLQINWKFSSTELKSNIMFAAGRLSTFLSLFD